MANLEENQERLLKALSTLEGKIATAKSNDPLRAENESLKAYVAQLEGQITTLTQAGQETMKDLDLALGQIAALKGTSHG